MHCPDGVYYGETGVDVPNRMAGHKAAIAAKTASNALFVHTRNNPGHSFNLKGAKLIFTSNQKSKRQLVESALIATNVNCNLKPGDFPVCRITAPIVLKGVKLDKSIVTHTSTNQAIPMPLPQATPPGPPNQATPMSSALATLPSTTDPAPATSNLTQALSNLAIQPISTPLVTTLAVSPSKEPTFPAQSQARSLPASHFIPPGTSPFLSPLNSPVVRKTHNHVILSQCYSPKPFTGAIRKRRFISNHSTSPAFSPMAKRLRSSKKHHSAP